MCGVSERSATSRALARPGWVGLYALAGLMLAALASAEMLVAPGAELTALQCGIVVAGFGGMVGWTRRNRAGLDRMDWCDCAGERVTMRVIQSHRRERARVVAANVSDLVETGAGAVRSRALVARRHHRAHVSQRRSAVASERKIVTPRTS